MANVSPSSQKVDDFLASLSQLSQERLKDNQNRQRRLQKDIDELRSTSGSTEYSLPRSLGRVSAQLVLSHGIRELTFNRSARGLFYEKWKDVAPELPKRPEFTSASPEIKSPTVRDRPIKPVKPVSISTPETPPHLPLRPLETTETVKINLLRPVARRSQPEKLLSETSLRPGSSTSTNGPISFAALEEKIRDNGRKSPELEKPPKLPVRKWESPISGLKEPSHEAHIGPTFVEATRERSSTRFQQKVPPPKPKSLKTYEKDNTELLKQLLRSLSPTKPVRDEKIASSQFSPEDHIKKLQEHRQKPDKPLKPKPTIRVPEETPEALSYLLKLKPTKPGPPKPVSKPEALRQFETMRNLEVHQDSRAKKFTNRVIGESALPSDLSVKQVPPTQFHAHLSNLLRANTDPVAAKISSASLPKQTPVRRSTAPLEATAPLIHPNKSRSKGPKRKLPKSQKTSSSRTLSSQTSAFDISVSASTPDSRSGTSLSASHESITSSAGPAPQPLKKVPPPIKGKKPALKAKPRRISSGELFL